MNVEQALEMASCARMNLDNMVTMMPTLGAHPLLPMVRLQLDECIKALEYEEEKP